MRRVYLDYAAATPIDPVVFKKMVKVYDQIFGNASSIYHSGRHAKNELEKSRKIISGILNCTPAEIIFTGSGTEADNLAILGMSRASRGFGKHIIVSTIEHPAVLRACEYLEKKEGFSITRIGVSKKGIIDVKSIVKALRRDTTLVSVMYVNNEIGTIQPIAEIAKEIHKFRLKHNRKNRVAFPVFHTDACQAAGALEINIQKLGVDLMTLSGSKIYGPKGVGCLYVKRGVKIEPVMLGGLQEMGLRAGTENVPLAAGFAAALKIADQKMVAENNRLTKMKARILDVVLKIIPGSRLNGDERKRLASNINLSFDGIDSEMLMLELDKKGIEASTGSACETGGGTLSHVLKAIGLNRKSASTAIRISLGRLISKKDSDYLLKILPRVVEKLRGL